MSVVLVVTGIALPSLLLAAAVKKWLAPVRWAVVALFLAMTFAFLHGAVFTDKLPVPVDEVARGYPWRGVVGEPTVKNPLTNDAAKLFLPWMAVAREELFHLRAPLWNRYSFSGYPLLGNGESAPFSPFFLATLFVPLPKQIVAMAGLKIFVSLLFGFLFAKRLGTSDAAACFAATAFAWSVFQTVFLYYSTTAVTALLPAALYAIFLAQAEASRRGVVLVAIVIASLMAAGHPESVLHIAIAAAGLLAIDLAIDRARRQWLRRFIAPLVGTGIGLALSAPAWVPVLRQVLLSARLDELSRAGGHPAMYPLTAAWAMVFPNGFGNPVRGNWSWILNYSSVASSYPGLVVLVLLVTSMFLRGVRLRERLWTGWAVLLWLVALSWSPVGRALNAMPPFGVVANDKLRFAALFIAACLAALAVDRLARKRSAILVMAAVPVVGLALYVYRAKPQLAMPADLVPALAVAVFVAVGVSVPRLAARAAFLATAVELLALNAGFNALVDARYDMPELPMVQALRAAAPAEPFRIAGYDWALLPNASARLELEDVRGSDPMAYASYARAIAPLVVDDPSIDVDRVVNVDDPLIDRLGVRFLIAQPGASFGGRWREIYSGRDGVLFENARARPRFWAEAPTATVTTEQVSPAHLKVVVVASEETKVASGQIGIEGWGIGSDDGVERRDDGIFVGFTAARGRHVVDVRYRPAAFYGSLVGTLLGALFLVLLAAGIGPVGRALCVVPEREAVLEKRAVTVDG